MASYCEQLNGTGELQIFEFSIATSTTQMLLKLQHSVNDIEIVMHISCRHSTPCQSTIGDKYVSYSQKRHRFNPCDCRTHSSGITSSNP